MNSVPNIPLQKPIKSLFIDPPTLEVSTHLYEEQQAVICHNFLVEGPLSYFVFFCGSEHVLREFKSLFAYKKRGSWGRSWIVHSQ